MLLVYLIQLNHYKYKYYIFLIIKLNNIYNDLDNLGDQVTFSLSGTTLTITPKS